MSEKNGVNVLEFIRSTKDEYPRDAGLLLLGPWVGDSCLNIDPFVLRGVVRKFGIDMQKVKSAEIIYSKMPMHKVEMVSSFSESVSVTLLVIAFKGYTDDPRYTSSSKIGDNLREKNFKVTLTDPFVPSGDICKDFFEARQELNILVLLTDHSEYKRIDLQKLRSIMGANPLIIDSRGLISREDAVKNGSEHPGVGFLGSYLGETLLKECYDITVVDDLSRVLKSNVSSIIDNIQFIKSDIAGFDYSEHFDVLINLASRASRMKLKTYSMEVAFSNSLGNNNLIKFALENKALYIYALSYKVYGDPDVVPNLETFIGKISKTGSRSPYDEGKRFGEVLGKAYKREYGLKDIIIKLFNSYGPRMRGGEFYGRVIDRFIQQAIKGEPLTVYGNGMQTRLFTYVSDSEDAISLLIRSGNSWEIYNVSNDDEITIIDPAMIILEITRSTSKINFLHITPFDPMKRAAYMSKLKSLGFSHRVLLIVGIETMIREKLSNSILIMR